MPSLPADVSLLVAVVQKLGLVKNLGLLVLLQLARFGGYLARTGDSPPGNMVVWKGPSPLTDTEGAFSSQLNLRVIESKIGR